jgi:chemotaxis protein MotB
MALSRRRREESNMWPGFVDAVTTLLMVLLFVLTIFTVMQSVLRDTITTQSNELSQLNDQVAQLAEALGLERTKVADLNARVGTLQSTLADAQAKDARQSALIATLNAQLTAKQDELTAAQGRIASFEDQVAALLAQKAKDERQIGDLTASLAEIRDAQAKLLTQKEALDLALAQARKEVDAQTEQARLAAARADAIQALVDDLKRKAADSETSLAAALANLEAQRTANATLASQLASAQAGQTAAESKLSDAEKARLAEEAAARALKQQLQDAQGQLSEAEKQRLADLAAAEALREKLKNADDELTAMTLALEDQRRKAEETLRLLAAAEAAKSEAQSQSQAAADQKAALLAEAQKILSEKDQELVKSAERMALLNQQLNALRAQLTQLQGILDDSAAKDVANQVQIQTLGSQLNAALAQVAAEQKKRADLEAAEAARLKAENRDLSKYQSEFFAQLSKLLEGQPGVRVVGDRFVFSSEVLFQPASAELSPEGRAQIKSVVDTLMQVVPQIPAGVPWIIRVDGHTDNTPLSGTGQFKDNWELSQARALSVVRYMQDVLGFPPERLAAAGFGEYQPVATGDTPEAKAQNRRIELKLTER